MIFPQAPRRQPKAYTFFYSNIQTLSNALVFNIYFLASTACWTAAVVPAGRWTGSLGTTTSSNSSWEMAVIVYVSVGDQPGRRAGAAAGVQMPMTRVQTAKPVTVFLIRYGARARSRAGAARMRAS
jgi:hypothetical protein